MYILCYKRNISHSQQVKQDSSVTQLQEAKPTTEVITNLKQKQKTHNLSLTHMEKHEKIQGQSYNIRYGLGPTQQFFAQTLLNKHKYLISNPLTKTSYRFINKFRIHQLQILPGKTTLLSSSSNKPNNFCLNLILVLGNPLYKH